MLFHVYHIFSGQKSKNYLKIQYFSEYEKIFMIKILNRTNILHPFYFLKFFTALYA